MNFISKHFTVAAILLSAICANAQDAAPAAQATPAAAALANAQKSYVSGNWKDAAAAYEKACPMQPKEKQPECLLWNILALSQTGDAASFKKAGKRLDSLVQKVNPQESLYADLMMTSAQFRLYLGKYDLAAQDLIHAIETSQPHHNVVLQKVCAAVKSKTTNEALNERCELLKNPDSLANLQKAKAEPAPQQAAVTATQRDSTSAKKDSAITAQPVAATKSEVQPAPAVAPVAEPEKPTVAPAPVAEAKPAPQPAATPVAAPAPAVASPAPVAATAPAAAPAQEYWVLQLGAFSVKDNATLLASTLKKRKIQATIVEQPRGEKTLYLVQSGNFATREAAVDFGAKQLAPLKVEFQPLLKK